MKSGHASPKKTLAAVLLTAALLSGCGSGNSSGTNPSEILPSSEGTAGSSLAVSGDRLDSVQSDPAKSSLIQSVASKSTTTSIATSSVSSASSSAPMFASSGNEVVRVSVWTPSMGTGNELVDIGLGEKETAHVSLNRDYEWYIDQFTTGEYGKYNGGPTCVAMAGKWYSKDFAVTAEEIRAKINLHQGSSGITGIYPSEIEYSLKEYKIPYQNKSKPTVDTMVDELTSGNILIVMVDMLYITFEPNSEYHVNKYVYWTDGHFFLIKGYRIVDGKLWFEVYEPSSRDLRYSNGQLKGKDRYYLAEEVVTGIQKGTNYYFSVGGNPLPSASFTGSAA